MKQIELDHWYMKDNELNISLMRFYASIKILNNSKFIYYQLFIKGEKTLTFNFYTLEDAMSFVENVVNRCNDTDEIVDKYISMLSKDGFKSPYQLKMNRD